MIRAKRRILKGHTALKDDGKGTLTAYATEGSRRADDIRAYDVYVIMVGEGVPAPLCGVLPMVALTPKGVRYPGCPANYDGETMQIGSHKFQTKKRRGYPRRFRALYFL